MATLPTRPGAMTLTDFAKTLDPDGKPAYMINSLAQTNEMLPEMMWMEGNLPTGHQTTIAAALPDVTWQILYKGIQPSSGKRVQVTETIGRLGARSEIDLALLTLNDNMDFVRAQEGELFIESMNQAMQEQLIYGNQAVTPERFTGFAPRYSSLSATNGVNIIDAGGVSTDNTSIYLIGWGNQSCMGIYPKGSKAGLTQQDLGEIDAFDDSTPPARFRAMAELFDWKAGLTVRDWRDVVRIANIDVSDLLAQTGTQAPTASTAIMKLMLRAMQKPSGMNRSRFAFYTNRTVKQMLSIAALDKSNTAVTIEPATNQFGTVGVASTGNGSTMRFFGIPVRTVDRILETETRVV